MKKIILVLIALITTLIVTTACEQSGPLAMDSKASKVTILSTGKKGFNKLFANTKTININGGQIIVGDYQSGLSGLNFPYGAINPSAYQTSSLSATDAAPGVNIHMVWQSTGLLEAEFLPHGLQFDQPVYIRLSYKETDLTNIDEQSLRIYYFNEDSDQYEQVASNVNTSDQFVYGYINHFSRYAIGYD